jgi:D-alanine-D-alanine ligase
VAGKLKILVLAGGDSEEREVSLASAKAITASLQRLGYDTAVIDSATGQSLLDSDSHYLLQEDSKSTSKIALQQSSMALTKSLNSDDYKDSDLVFLALHGGTGEDGTIQALLDLAGLKYTGSDRLSSAAAMNKAFAKRILKNEAVPTPDWMVINLKRPEDIEVHLSNLYGKFDYPLIVKPNNSGSTIGLTLVKNPDDLKPAMESAFEVSKEILVEQYIKGREITGAVLNGQPLPLVEIVPTGELYDYQCKYTKGKSQYICPAQIPDSTTSEIQQLAGKAYEILNCSGLARVDFILDKNNQPYFLEVNTLPGMTELSLAPMAAKESGLSFDDLIESICKAALEK